MPRNVADIRNLAICGHGNSGKTTLVDQILIQSGAVNANPSVDAGTSICDFDEEEKHHKHSIESTVTHYDHGGKHFNLIDTPGYPDLVGQMIGSLAAVETALVAIDAHAGIKVNTRRAWEEAGKAGCGRIVVLTKLDVDNIEFLSLVDGIKEVRQQLRTFERAVGIGAHGVDCREGEPTTGDGEFHLPVDHIHPETPCREPGPLAEERVHRQ